MPLPPVWNLAVQNQRLYVKCGGEVQVNRGPLIGVRESKEKPNHIKVKYRSTYCVILAAMTTHF